VQVATLTLVLQGREVRTFVLEAAKTTIGRAQDNDIVINNLALSRYHAEVHRRDGAHQVEDRGSQNGVYVNDERIHQPRVLRDGDIVTLGTYRFLYRGEPASDGPPPASSAKLPRARAPTEVSLSADAAPPPTPPGAVGRAGRIPLLVLRYNDVEVQRFPLEGTEVVVGRSRDCDIQIAERRLSRRHCELKRSEGDRVFVRDLKSQNGTFVNRVRVQEFRELQHGDILNFAEYSILFLSDVNDYDGPDRLESRGQVAAVPRVRTGIEKEDTEMPPAYEDEGPSRHQVQVVSVAPAAPIPPPPSGPRTREPWVEAPSRAKAKKRRVDAPPEAWIERRRGAPSPLAVPPEPDPRETSDLEDEAMVSDVDDPIGEERPDAALEAWYREREIREEDGFADEPSSLLERSPSRVSRVLSTMMIDRRELDRNLARKARRRRFGVHVTARSEVIFSGELENEVTVMGKDPEADILLQGRYVAGRHSLLVRVRDSLLLVRLGSSSAARVNGLPKLQAFLRAGDVVQIDETTLEIREL
jgi:pSer/pThr/pTyr-binding forkhead associated (FHA) protein